MVSAKLNGHGKIGRSVGAALILVLVGFAVASASVRLDPGPISARQFNVAQPQTVEQEMVDLRAEWRCLRHAALRDGVTAACSQNVVIGVPMLVSGPGDPPAATVAEEMPDLRRELKCLRRLVRSSTYAGGALPERPLSACQSLIP